MIKVTRQSLARGHRKRIQMYLCKYAMMRLRLPAHCNFWVATTMGREGQVLPIFFFENFPTDPFLRLL